MGDDSERDGYGRSLERAEEEDRLPKLVIYPGKEVMEPEIDGLQVPSGPEGPTSGIDFAKRRPYIGLAVLSSLIGGVLMIATPFAGAEWWNEEQDLVDSIVIDNTSSAGLVLVMIVISIALFICMGSTLTIVDVHGWRLQEFTMIGLLSACLAFALVVGLTIGFVWFTYFGDITDMWFGPAFYAGLIGSGLSVYSLWHIRGIHKAIDPGSQEVEQSSSQMGEDVARHRL